MNKKFITNNSPNSDVILMHYPILRTFFSGRLRINYPLKYFYTKMKYLIKYRTFDFFNDINIEINTSCNMRCKYCPNHIYERGLIENEKLMDEELFKKIINDLADINFSGRISPQFFGEPLLDKRLTIFMKYIKEKLPKAKIIIISNGDALTIEKYKELTDAGVFYFIVTQHGNEMNSNMKEIFKYVKKRPKNSEKIRLDGFQRYQKIKNNIEYQKLDLNVPLYNRGGLVDPPIVEYAPNCQFIFNPLVIDHEGNIILCCSDYFSSIKFGNVKDKSIVEIWNCKEYKKIRSEIKKSIYNSDICKKCVGLIK